MGESHFSADFRSEFLRFFRSVHGFFIQKRKYTRGGSQRILQLRNHGSNVIKGLCILRGIGQEGA